MSKSVEDTRRQLFEHEYVQYRQYLKRNKDGSYNEEWVESRWQGFNAALDCVEIELPHEVSHVTCPQFEEGRDAVLVAIEATNLGLKIK